MAASALAHLGSKYGPCRSSCQHKDCAETRRMAAAVCRFCSKPIGYGSPFYREIDELSHAQCLEVAIEQGKA